MFGVDASAAGRRPGMIALGLIAAVLSATTAHAQAAPAPAAGQTPAAGQPPAGGQTPAAGQAPAAPTTRLFASDAGMVLNFIKPDKGPDFESVIAKLKEALQKSEKPERKQQAQSWKVFKSPDPAAGGNLLYVFVIDPAVKEADYTVSNILAEAFEPAEVNDLYKKYAEAYATGQNFVNLTLVADLK
jgi:pyruvate/2-oxoglutarate dehydrogenase complex dihydrolipoamide acyltransferase (E2) component